MDHTPSRFHFIKANGKDVRGTWLPIFAFAHSNRSGRHSRSNSRSFIIRLLIATLHNWYHHIFKMLPTSTLHNWYHQNLQNAGSYPSSPGLLLSSSIKYRPTSGCPYFHPPKTITIAIIGLPQPDLHHTILHLTQKTQPSLH